MLKSSKQEILTFSCGMSSQYQWVFNTKNINHEIDKYRYPIILDVITHLHIIERLYIQIRCFVSVQYSIVLNFFTCHITDMRKLHPAINKGHF